MHSLVFRETQFDVIDRNGQPWLRSPQIAGALGYNRADRIADVYNRNADEFTDSMTALVELDTNGGKQHVRIFSLRGVHLLAMLSRTAVAKEFRHWVLDVLEGVAEAPTPAKAKRPPKALPNGLTTDQQASIKALVKARVEVMPKDKQAKAAITCWSALKSKFGCTYKEINPERFTEAVSLVARVSLEGEFIPRAEGGSLGRIPVFELEILKATVHGRIDGLPNSVRRSALARIWQEIHARMGVDRYRDILPEQTAEACRIAASCDLHLNHQQYADPVEALIAARLEELPQSMRERGSRRIKSALQRRFDYRPWGSDMVLACRIVTETEIDDLCHYESGGEILDEVDIEPDATLAGMTANHFIFSSPSGVIRTIGLDKMSADSAFVTDRTSYLIGMAIGQRLN
jgi:prophage antirepressor-like protein